MKIQVKVEDKWMDTDLANYLAGHIKDIRLVDDTDESDECSHRYCYTRSEGKCVIDEHIKPTKEPKQTIEKLVILRNRPIDPHSIWLAIIDNRITINEIIDWINAQD